VFVPIRYVYPSRTAFFRKLTLTLTTLWLVSYAAILVQMPDPDPLLRAFSLIYLVYYFTLSFYISGKLLKVYRTEQTEA
jgi:phosphatidylcholine synthase